MVEDTSETSISLNEIDAEFVNHLQKYGEPVYLGEYSPDYENSNDMSGLNHTTNSPLAKYNVEIGFTLSDDLISALKINFERVTIPIDLTTIIEKLNNLMGIKELIISLPSGKFTLSGLNCKNLEYLYFRVPNTGELKIHEIHELLNLVVIVVNGPLALFPDFSHHQNVQRIVLPKSQSSEFPISVCELPKLVWLEVGNQFSSIPNDLLKLKNLIILDLWSHNLSTLPKDFGELPNLLHLTIQAPKLDQIPLSFEKLNRLTDLYLWNLSIKIIPDQVCNLPELKFLWIRNNTTSQGKLEFMSDKIGNLTNLIELQVNGNKIKDIPNSIGNLKKLRVLNLANNQINDLPPEISDLGELRELKLYYNPIAELPNNFEKLQNLELLDISDTIITTLPDSFGKLKNLENFDAIGTPISNISDNIDQLDPNRFTNFQLNLNINIDELNERIKMWLETLQNMSNEEKSISIVQYQSEQNPFEDELALIEDPNFISEKIDNHIRLILKQALNKVIAHVSFKKIVNNFPYEYANKKFENFPNTFYELFEHIRLTFEDIIEYIEDPEYKLWEFPDDYWNDLDGSPEELEKSIKRIHELLAIFDRIIDDPNSKLYEVLEHQPETGHTIFREIIIIIAHNSFHLGQIVLMMKSMNIWIN